MIQLRDETRSEDVLAPLVMAWTGRAQECKRHKKPFNDVAAQCMEFFAGSMGFMWNQEFINKYMGGIPAPRFRLTICKAFELVALYGPTLYWEAPERVVRAKQRRATLRPEMIAAAFGQDPQAMQLVDSMGQTMQQRSASHAIVSALLDGYLNYTPGEQPQGLDWHAMQVATESLVKGRSCLWPMPYSPPNSNRVLTGCFYDSVDNLLIDPDATSIHDAKYIIKMETKPTRQVEEEFGLPRGELDGKGSVESSYSQGASRFNANAQLDRQAGTMNDLITVYKVWSKHGIGADKATIQKLQEPLNSALDSLVGRYAYVAFAENVRYPLNCPSRVMMSATDEEIRQRFQWPVPYWLDNRWPVVVVDYYNRPNDPWAIAPLAPGLGELTFINVMMSALATKIYNTSRILIFGAEDLGQNIEGQIKSGADLGYVAVSPSAGKVSDRLELMKFPEVNSDVWEMIERTSYNFDRRTGITELMAGMTPGNKIARVAEDVRQRSEASQIRPEYMRKCFFKAMSEAADMEKLAARWFVEPQHLGGLYGPTEQFLWGQFINGVDPELVVREFEATVVAASGRRPDRVRDMEDFQQIAQIFLPFLTQYSMQSGDIEPVNGVIRRWGEATDTNVDDMLLNPEKIQQQMQMAQQAQQQEAEAAQAEMQSKLEQQSQEHQVKLQQQMEQHQAKLQMQAEQHQMKMATAADQLRFSSVESGADMQQQAAKFMLETLQDASQHRQEMTQDAEAHKQKMRLAEQASKVQQAIARRKSQQPTTNGKGSRK